MMMKKMTMGRDVCGSSGGGRVVLPVTHTNTIFSRYLPHPLWGGTYLYFILICKKLIINDDDGDGS